MRYEPGISMRFDEQGLLTDKESDTIVWLKKKKTKKPTPTNKALYSRSKNAKRKFDVYPSA